MKEICIYQGKTHLLNLLCNGCSLFLNTCSPVAYHSGYALNSEQDCYLCEGCEESSCINKLLLNL